jgi:hypothetical protein
MFLICALFVSGKAFSMFGKLLETKRVWKYNYGCFLKYFLLKNILK